MNNYRKTRAVDKIIEIINKFIISKTSFIIYFPKQAVKLLNIIIYSILKLKKSVFQRHEVD
jgi:hypothetical protein